MIYILIISLNNLKFILIMKNQLKYIGTLLFISLTLVIVFLKFLLFYIILIL